MEVNNTCFISECNVYPHCHGVPWMLVVTRVKAPQALLLGSNSGLLDGVSLAGRTGHTDQPSALATSEIP